MVIFDKPEQLIHWLGQLLKMERPQAEISAGFVCVFDSIIEELMTSYEHSVCCDDEWLQALLYATADSPRPVRCSEKILDFIAEVYSIDLGTGKLDLEGAMRLLFEFIDIGDDELQVVKSVGERYVVSTPKFESDNELRVCISLEQALSPCEREIL